MELSQLTIRIVILLLPGAIATLLVDKISTHSKWNDFQFVLFSILLGATSYLFLQIIVFILEARQVLCFAQQKTMLSVWNSFVNPTQSIDPYEVIKACLLSVPLALFITYLNEKKIFNRFAQWSKMSTKYGDENLFFFLLNSKDVKWVYVRRISQNLTYEGFVDAFAATKTTYELFLREVRVYRYADSKLLYEVSNIYLSMPQNDVIIEVPTTNARKDTAHA